ncbi:hypothetical protein FHT40_002519 [Mycolicibacterium sp. BK556]|uniref:hypothetical protein n=1 Tax=Mycobacteriaceae TaxID=1762 RepID=UPI0010D1DD45|nr:MULTISPECIES: hypothetical protein [Mycobacteriaceae]MBB3602858.1 hypothetical protein [Mycolicibacterium sp. BK556]MBB3633053.1 hypothetical protein [Mycolicibacterium sp. BK607]MBB3750600.1 hypothetical protein [Mycolicibacterium sp. BK634]TDO07029.1 hypothetical protein EV580_5991 [Mycobacterium sp. BK086]
MARRAALRDRLGRRDDDLHRQRGADERTTHARQYRNHSSPFRSQTTLLKGLPGRVISIDVMSEPTEETTKAYEPPSSHRPARQSRSTNWIAVVALVIALIAVGVATWALLRPTPQSAAPAASQSGDPKANACAAYRTVSSAVSLQSHANAGAEVQGVAANARLAMSGGATYLLAHLNPGTPADLADAIRAFATGLQDISMNALAGVPNGDAAQADRLRNAETLNTRIAELCK